MPQLHFMPNALPVDEIEIPGDEELEPTDTGEASDDLPDLLDVSDEEAVAIILEEIRQQSFDFTRDLAEIRQIDFRLDAHPEDDVVGFNELYAAVQAHHSRVTKILMQLYREKGIWQRYRSRVKLYLRRKRNFILAGFTPVQLKQLKTKEVIEATIQERMPQWFDLMDRIEGVLEDLELLIDTAVLKRDELLNANVNMSRQQKAVETLIGLQYPVSARRPQSN